VRVGFVTLAVLALAPLAGGCNKNCQSTCERIYGAECGIALAGIDAETLQRDCQNECEDALEQPGAMGSYNPYNQRDPTEDFHLQNEKQAAEWMDCVWSASCEELEPQSGICYPI
jgi:hypothetical protein